MSLNRILSLVADDRVFDLRSNWSQNSASFDLHSKNHGAKSSHCLVFSERSMNCPKDCFCPMIETLVLFAKVSSLCWTPSKTIVCSSEQKQRVHISRNRAVVLLRCDRQSSRDNNAKPRGRRKKERRRKTLFPTLTQTRSSFFPHCVHPKQF